MGSPNHAKVHQHTQDLVIKTHTTMVKRIARQLMTKLPQSVQLDDLIQAGMIGLLEALKNYDTNKGASFDTYANIRIRGHMLDEVRRNNWIPRSVYRNARLIAAAVKKIENKFGREAKDKEIASELKLEMREYYQLLQESALSQIYCFEDLGLTDDILVSENNHLKTEPHKNVLHQDLLAHLTDIINGLPPKEQIVLSLYYEQDLNLKEIGKVLGVSESRVSQIHTQAALRIKARLEI